VADTKVTIAYVHGMEVTYSWFQSMMALVSYDVANHAHIIGGGWLATKYGTGGIVQARNDTARQFTHHTDSEWLFWIDTDMGFSPDTVDRLLEVADPETAPVVGALCFMNRELGPDGMGGMLTQPVPTIFQWWKEEVAGGFRAQADYPRDQLTQVAGTGSACLLIHRSVFERIEAEYGPSWYSPVQSSVDRSWLSEDLSFCMRCAALEIPIAVHTGVKTSHLKHIWLDERHADRTADLERIG
jgi:hypothetical protein